LYLRRRLKEIRVESQNRGLVLESEINEAAKPALRVLMDAYRQMDKQSDTARLTTIQRNRMAVNFLGMNDQPEKYEYFRRFIDVEAYDELQAKHLSGRAAEEAKLEELKSLQKMVKLTKKQIRDNRRCASVSKATAGEDELLTFSEAAAG